MKNNKSKKVGFPQSLEISVSRFDLDIYIGECYANALLHKISDGDAAPNELFRMASNLKGTSYIAFLDAVQANLQYVMGGEDES